jgi:hypothetical protein
MIMGFLKKEAIQGYEYRELTEVEIDKLFQM